MKRYRFIVMLFIFAVMLISPALAFEEIDHTSEKDDSEPAPAKNTPVVTQKEKGLVDWTNNYVEATGMAVAPTGTKGAQAKALARRGAMLDLQRNLLEFLVGVQIDADTRMENFMAEDRVRSELHGIIRNVEATSGEWDGESYVMKGRIKLGQIRTLIAPSLPPAPTVYPEVGATPDITIYAEPEPAPAPRKPSAPRKSKARYTGLVIDVRHLPYVPSMTFQVYDANGRAVYGMNFVNRSSFLSSGICSYLSNINAAKGELFVASNPIVTKAVRLGKSNVDIFISNSAAAQIRSSSYDFRKDCKVIIVSR